MDSKEFIEQIKEQAWLKVRSLMKADIYHDISAYSMFEQAVNSTFHFLVHVCGFSLEEATPPDDITNAERECGFLDLEDEDEEEA